MEEFFKISLRNVTIQKIVAFTKEFMFPKYVDLQAWVKHKQRKRNYSLLLFG